MSPDWSEDPTAIPYADKENPQSLNLYGYVGNNPLSRSDSDGHRTVCDPDTYSTDANGTLTVTAGKCHYELDSWDLPGYAFVGLANVMTGHATQGAVQMGWAYLNGLGLAYGPISRLLTGSLVGLNINDSVMGPNATKTLNNIDNNVQTPNQKGGATFDNTGAGGSQKLPSTDSNGNPITYKEYDVQPKQAGNPRTAERLVKGSDGSVYYTTDHYANFTQVRKGR
jgi:guanyl-specific ribonuclease Sa